MRFVLFALVVTTPFARAQSCSAYLGRLARTFVKPWVLTYSFRYAGIYVEIEDHAGYLARARYDRATVCWMARAAALAYRSREGVAGRPVRLILQSHGRYLRGGEFRGQAAYDSGEDESLLHVKRIRRLAPKLQGLHMALFAAHEAIHCAQTRAGDNENHSALPAAEYQNHPLEVEAHRISLDVLSALAPDEQITVRAGPRLHVSPEVSSVIDPGA